MSKIKAFILSLCCFLGSLVAHAQCAMCKTQLKNNVSEGDTAMAEGLNIAILFLFVTPYILVFILAVLWLRNSKVKAKKINILERLKKTNTQNVD